MWSQREKETVRSRQMLPQLWNREKTSCSQFKKPRWERHSCFPLRFNLNCLYRSLNCSVEKIAQNTFMETPWSKIFTAFATKARDERIMEQWKLLHVLIHMNPMITFLIDVFSLCWKCSTLKCLFTPGPAFLTHRTRPMESVDTIIRENISSSTFQMRLQMGIMFHTAGHQSPSLSRWFYHYLSAAAEDFRFKPEVWKSGSDESRKRRINGEL